MIIDKREPKEIRDKFADAKLDELKVGDYIVGNELYERKTAKDLVTSLLDGRLWLQAYELKNQTDYNSIIAITGNIWKALYLSGIKKNKNVYFGIVRSLILKYKLPLMYFYDDDEFIEYLKFIDKRKETPSTPSLPIRKGRDIKYLRHASLSCIRGVSFKRAEMLLSKFGTIKNIANATVDDLMNEGLGKKTSKNIYEFYNE